jgi:outer membrane protein assembly factor BamB
MSKDSIRRFELTHLILQYDYQTHTLLCRNIDDGKNLWIRKIGDGGYILDVSEDKDRIFLSIETDEKSGQFLVLNKKDGLTDWFIPGKAFMFRLFINAVYLIFIDGDDNFFLIKTSAEDGSKLWHHPVHDGLSGYTINNDTVTLAYYDGSIEVLNSSSGEIQG